MAHPARHKDRPRFSVKPLPKKFFGTPHLRYVFHPLLWRLSVVSLKKKRHRPDASPILRPPKAVLESTLRSTLCPPPPNWRDTVLPPPPPPQPLPNPNLLKFDIFENPYGAPRPTESQNPHSNKKKIPKFQKPRSFPKSKCSFPKSKRSLPKSKRSFPKTKC